MRKLIYVLILQMGVCFVLLTVLKNIKPEETEALADIKQVKSGKSICVNVGTEYEIMDLEEYVARVLAAQAEADWNLEMLKMQAVLIRTSICHEMVDLGESANIINEEQLSEIRYEDIELKNFWGEKYVAMMKKIQDATIETQGQVITYKGELIMPAQSLVTIGKTVSAKELYGVDIPYLQSVDSSMDVNAPGFSTTVTYSKSRLEKEFDRAKIAWPESGNSIKSEFLVENKKQSTNETLDAEALEDGSTSENINLSPEELMVVSATENGFATWINVFGELVAGEAFAEVLKLPSSNIHISEDEEGYKIISIGQGSSLGLSIYGSKVLSERGMGYEEIIKYYYKDVDIIFE